MKFETTGRMRQLVTKAIFGSKQIYTMKRRYKITYDKTKLVMIFISISTIRVERSSKIETTGREYDNRLEKL